MFPISATTGSYAVAGGKKYRPGLLEYSELCIIYISVSHTPPVVTVGSSHRDDEIMLQGNLEMSQVPAFWLETQTHHVKETYNTDLEKAFLYKTAKEAFQGSVQGLNW